VREFGQGISLIRFLDRVLEFVLLIYLNVLICMISFGDNDNEIVWNEIKNKGDREGGALTSEKNRI